MLVSSFITNEIMIYSRKNSKNRKLNIDYSKSNSINLYRGNLSIMNILNNWHADTNLDKKSARLLETRPCC